MDITYKIIIVVGLVLFSIILLYLISPVNYEPYINTWDCMTANDSAQNTTLYIEVCG